MSETTIINCDICGNIFEPEPIDDYYLTYYTEDEDEELVQHQMDICKECFGNHILPLKRN